MERRSNGKGRYHAGMDVLHGANAFVSNFLDEHTDGNDDVEIILSMEVIAHPRMKRKNK